VAGSLPTPTGPKTEPETSRPLAIQPVNKITSKNPGIVILPGHGKLGNYTSLQLGFGKAIIGSLKTHGKNLKVDSLCTTDNYEPATNMR